MKIASVNNAAAPIVSPSGEQITELLGAPTHLGSTQKQSVAFSKIPVGEHSTAHFHKQSEETLYILSGRARLVVDDQCFDVKPGDACFIQPGETHSLYNIDDALELQLLAITSPPWDITDVYEDNEEI